MTEVEISPLSFHANGPEMYAAYNTILALETRWVPAVSGEGRHESHPYVSYPLGRFLLGMRAAQTYFARFDSGRNEPRRFIDVGCGVGTKVMLAAQMNWEADGLDFVPEYVDAARDLNVNSPSRIFEVEANGFGEYGSYDLIFAYRPMVSDERMAKLVDVICRNTAPGTMLFIPTYDPTTDLLAEYDENLGLWTRPYPPDG